MNAKSIAGWLLVALVAWWAIENPHNAGQIVHNVGNFLSTAASGITNFFRTV